LGVVAHFVFWRLHVKTATASLPFVFQAQETVVFSRRKNTRSRHGEGLDAADMVEMTVRTYREKVKACLLASQDIAMNVIFQFQTRAIISAIMRTRTRCQ
jgi:hypothetical protein